MKVDEAFLQHTKRAHPFPFSGVLHRPHVPHDDLHRPAAAERAAHSAVDVGHAAGIAAPAPADRLTAAATAHTETLRGKPHTPSYIIRTHQVPEST